MKRTPMKRTAFKRAEGPTATKERKPMARAEKKPGRCRHCRKALSKVGEKLHDACVAPWWEANQAKVRDKAAKADRVRDRAKRQALKPLAKLIAEAQIEFNAYIRARDKDKGCFVCLRPFEPAIPGRALHAGHVRSRGAAGHLRFTEDNCMGECEGCNGPRGAKPHQIKAGAIARIGAARFEELESDNAPHKWTREELIGIKATYRAKRKEAEAA
jgi:5-methylcytosine-specific restriction endonuclease McrA